MLLRAFLVSVPREAYSKVHGIMVQEVSSVEVGERIIAIQSLLASDIESERRASLISEQRRLWDMEFRGRPFEAIQYDVWLTRRWP